nr:caspase-1-like isoform X1 [Megalopta genalis]
MDKQPRTVETEREVGENPRRKARKQNKMAERETEPKQQQPMEAEKQSAEQCDSSIRPGTSNVDGWMFKKPKTRWRRLLEMIRIAFSRRKRLCDASDAQKLPKKESIEPPAGPEGVITQVPVDSEVYHMNHKRRGVVLIFNHINFKRMASRKGSVKDSKDLTETFNRLGFEIREYVDTTVPTIVSILKSTAAEDHTDADCLIVVTMSHGESGFVYAADTMYPVDMLWAQFTGDRCATLVGKPKLFFIQACRGARLDNGVEMKVVHETDSADVYRIPTHADIMVAYSTFDGFYSWRNPDSGSWFIQALCEELNQNGRTRDLLTIMTFVNRRVAIQYQSFVPQDEHFHQRKQIPSIVSMLTRLVYFGEKAL